MRAGTRRLVLAWRWRHLFSLLFHLRWTLHSSSRFDSILASHLNGAAVCWVTVSAAVQRRRALVSRTRFHSGPGGFFVWVGRVGCGILIRFFLLLFASLLSFCDWIGAEEEIFILHIPFVHPHAASLGFETIVPFPFPFSSCFVLVRGWHLILLDLEIRLGEILLPALLDDGWMDGRTGHGACDSHFLLPVGLGTSPFLLCGGGAGATRSRARAGAKRARLFFFAHFCYSCWVLSPRGVIAASPRVVLSFTCRAGSHAPSVPPLGRPCFSFCSSLSLRFAAWPYSGIYSVSRARGHLAISAFPKSRISSCPRFAWRHLI
ncbi:hypothetical protein K438DRAFT_99720 [Mycena galopus ATCC 62051]|nr:hypothetical protein K438DRAFT_99720 [Mycena galopus ATCC 62051]